MRFQRFSWVAVDARGPTKQRPKIGGHDVSTYFRRNFQVGRLIPFLSQISNRTFRQKLALTSGVISCSHCSEVRHENDLSPISKKNVIWYFIVKWHSLKIEIPTSGLWGLLEGLWNLLRRASSRTPEESPKSLRPLRLNIKWHPPKCQITLFF